MSFIRVIKPGVQSSVQDLGRQSYRHAGVPLSGAFDRDAHFLGNLLLENNPDDASIEMTLDGGVFEVEGGCWFCLSGARMSHARMITNDQAVPIPHLKPVRVEGDCRIDIGPIEEGMRGYLCFSGGVQTGSVLGSRSTLVANPIVGLGRALRSGDTLPLADSFGTAPHGMEIAINQRASDPTIRIVKSHHTSKFEPAHREHLARSDFIVSSRSNRAGIRLEGHPMDGPIPSIDRSVGTLPGYIQVPPDGNPIILGVDGPVTGGYPVIGCVIEADLGKVAQLRPNAKVRFAWIEREHAFVSAGSDA